MVQYSGHGVPQSSQVYYGPYGQFFGPQIGFGGHKMNSTPTSFGYPTNFGQTNATARPSQALFAYFPTIGPFHSSESQAITPITYSS